MCGKRIMQFCHYCERYYLGYVAHWRSHRENESERELLMGQIHSFYPKQDGKITFYEVTDLEGRAEWGGEQANEAVLWFARDPLNKRVIASLWYADEEDSAPLGTIDVTALCLASMASGRGRA